VTNHPPAAKLKLVCDGPGEAQNTPRLCYAVVAEKDFEK
jgi:hypothetical protein